MRGVIITLVLGLVILQAGTFDPVRPDESTWTCYDHSVQYAHDNPEWRVVTMSNNPNFWGVSHMVNYRIENGTMYMYDASIGMGYCFPADYLREEMPWGYRYFHGWGVNETPWRNYRRLRDNFM